MCNMSLYTCCMYFEQSDPCRASTVTMPQWHPMCDLSELENTGCLQKDTWSTKRCRVGSHSSLLQSTLPLVYTNESKHTL